MTEWAQIRNEEDVSSPALLVYPERIRENVHRMRSLLGGLESWRPHIKTHKIAEIVQLLRAEGIDKFKAATLAEAELCAACGAVDVLLAYPLVGPAIPAYLALRQRHPATRFSCLVDSVAAADSLRAAGSGEPLDVFVDLNVGMDRTGFPLNGETLPFCRILAADPAFRFRGLHAYDGHVHAEQQTEVIQLATAAFTPVWHRADALRAAGLPSLVVAGGTPSLPYLAHRPGVEVGAGTVVLWDAGEAALCPYLDFLPAAALLTRVISRPGPGRYCLDLGHKAVASEMPHPRISLPRFPDAQFVLHNEEHLVMEIPSRPDLPVGTVLYAIPRHICPTTALHEEVQVVREGAAVATWRVIARGRKVPLLVPPCASS